MVNGAPVRASQTRAAMYGRKFMIQEDIKLLAGSILEHRVILSSSVRLQE